MTRHRKRKHKSNRGSRPEVDFPGESSVGEHSVSPKDHHSEEKPSCSSQGTGAETRSVPAKVTSSSKKIVAKKSTMSQGAQSHGAPPSLPHPHMVFWQETVREWYPHYDKQTYFVPSAFMNRMQLTETQAAGQIVLQIDPPVTQPNVPDSLQDKDVREDKAHQKVLDCIQRLQGQQAMFVISQLQFGNYLGEPAYAAAAEMLYRPKDFLLASQNKDQGDFDILIIHKDFGILAGEIKSVGDNFSALNKSEEELDSILIRKVKEAIKQLMKSNDVLTHIVPTHDNLNPRIKTTLMLPNIAKEQLERALSTNQNTKTDLCQSLGLKNTEDPITLCLTKEDLENPFEWWDRIMTREGKDPVLQSADSVYLDLISRFCGPATTITVHCPSTPRLARGTSFPLRSRGNGIAETARRFAPVDIMLHPKQVNLLNAMQPLVYIAGPPGTGKSVVLLIKARDWLKQQKTVLLVSTHPEGLGASYMIEAQLEQSGGTQGQVQILPLDLTKGDYTDALSELQNKAQHGELYIIADEVFNGSAFRDLCRDLKQAVPGLHLWAASLYHGKCPGCLTEVIFTEPLRTPPRVTKEIEESGFFTQAVVECYTIPRGPLPTDGPAIISLFHEGEGHGHGTTYDCRQCGQNIAEQLMELGVGQAASADDPRSYQHVFILTEGQDLMDKKQDLVDMGPGTSAAAPRYRGLLLGLQDSNIPYKVLQEGDIDGIKQVATMSGPNEVIVSQSKIVSGLERPVVVWVQRDQASQDENNGRLHAMSRTTAQLIWVRCPP